MAPVIIDRGPLDQRRVESSLQVISLMKLGGRSHLNCKPRGKLCFEAGEHKQTPAQARAAFLVTLTADILSIH